VTETIESTSAAPDAPAPEGSESTAKKRGGGLTSLLLADLKAMAGGMGIKGAGSMKKAQLVEAIKAAQSGKPAQESGSAAGAAQQSAQQSAQPRTERPARKKVDRTQDELPAAEAAPQVAEQAEAASDQRDDALRTRDRESHGRESREAQNRESREAQNRESREARNRESREAQTRESREAQNRESREAQTREGREGQQNREGREGQQNREGREGQGREGGGNRQQNREGQNREGREGQNREGQTRDRQQVQEGQQEAGGRNRRRRGRERDRERQPVGGRTRGEPDTTILDDDVLVPAAGILDVLDNYAFVRTSGYLPGTDDVYVSLSMVRKFGLRRGDAIVGQVRQPREGERKEKFNPMVRIDSVNGADPETAKDRVDFTKLTPLYPSERLRLETDKDNLIGRVIDIAAPIGKGQRGLIVSPAKAGKTMIMQSIANSITTNNPECHLMVVLVDERPEEVTDFQRSVKGEVISSTFDRPASDHTTVAELAIERAKRLVELGHDVVVLLDGITRLGRAYNLAAPVSGRILSGGVDSAALYPPKKFFGAARNIENGGSLTILATALIESGSKMDEVIFEEFKGTGNMEIRLRRDFADKRLFPAIDAVQSGTRREELLMSKEELAIVWKLRRVLSGLDGQQALELLIERLKKSQSNIEFLMQVQKTTPGADNNG